MRAIVKLGSKAFFDHYDGCMACKRVPGNLCTDGARMLREASEALAAALVPIPPIERPKAKA